MEKIILNPSEEGLTHINVYSKSNLEIGRMLSNFYKHKILTEEGEFLSIEAYWYYLEIDDSSGEKEVLKTLYGYEAKKTGLELLKSYGKIEDPNFEEKISDAIFQKFLDNKEMLLTNEKYLYLPFEHYYNFDGRIVDVKDKYKWMIDNITHIRGHIIDNYL